MDNLIDLSVVIVNYNVRYFMEQCILSVLDASRNLKVEIIVVDNNSKDDSCQLLEQKFPQVHLIKNKENVGFSKANNQGVAISKGTYVLVLNPDVVISEDSLELIFKFAMEKQNFGILGVKLIDGSGNFLPESKRGLPTPQVAFNKLFGISSKRTGKYYATHINENESGIVDVLVGAFMFLKRDVFLEVGGFDETYFMYGEDIDLSYQVSLKGYQNYYFANVKAIHYKGECTERSLKYLRYFHRAMKIFYRKYFKLNWIYDFIMNIGIELWFVVKYFNSVSYHKKENIFNNVMYLGEDKYVSKYLKKNYLLIENNLIDDFNQIKSLIKIREIDTLVFDNSTISNKKIIEHMETLKDEGVIFKIHPKTSNFLIGSINSKQLGQVEVIS